MFYVIIDLLMHEGDFSSLCFGLCTVGAVHRLLFSSNGGVSPFPVFFPKCVKYNLLIVCYILCTLSSMDCIIYYMMEERSIFALNLIRYRKRRGYSQGDLSEVSNISRRMIAHYETHATVPPIDKIEALAKALGIKASQLLENPEDASQADIDLSDIDSRSIKKLKDILSLPPEDRNDLYRMLNKLVRKNQLEQERFSQEQH